MRFVSSVLQRLVVPGRKRRSDAPDFSGCAALPSRLAIVGFLHLMSIGSTFPCNDSLCSCLVAEELAEELVASDAVFIGTVVETREVQISPSSAGIPYRSVRLRVLGSWVGEEGSEIVVRTGVSTADCGFPFEHGASYLVFARMDGDGLAVSSCSRTAPVAEALEDLATLGPPPLMPGSR